MKKGKLGEVTIDETTGEEIEWVSKSEVKRDLKDNQSLIEDLVELDNKKIKRLPVSDYFEGHLLDLKGMKASGARKRQMQFCAKILRDEDIDAISDQLDAFTMEDKKSIAKLHLLETYRDQLIEGDNALMTQLIDEHPSVDVQSFRQALRNAQKEAKKNESLEDSKKQKKAYKALYQYLKENFL